MSVQERKCEAKLNANLWLLGVCFTLFTLIITINPAMLRDNPFLSLQLTLAIPFLMSSIFVRTKLMYSENPRFWDNYGFINFIIAYSFLVNVIGLLLSTMVSVNTGMAFFFFNIIIAL